MATPKASAPQKKASPKAPSPAVAAEPAYDPSKDRRALAALRARWGEVDADHRAAFDELIDDAGRAALGAKTRAAGVVNDAVTWAVQMDEDLRKYPVAVEEHYARERFLYFLDRIAALDAAITTQSAQRGGQTTTRGTGELREEAARRARKALIGKMRGFAGRRDAERDALTTAAGTTDGATELGASIARLVGLAGEWLGREGKVAAIQCKTAGLTAKVVGDAATAAEALTGAATDAKLAGRRTAIDAPETNLHEGTVLHEMEEAARCFGEAHNATQLIRRLVPGAATRHVLGAKTTRSKAPAEEKAPEPVPA